MLIPLLLTLTVATAAPASTPPRTADARFTFRIGFWNNLHHFLYVLGRARNNAPDARRDAVSHAPADTEGLAERSDVQRAAWDEAIAFYAAGPSKQDAVFDADLVRQTQLLAATADGVDPSAPGLDPALVAVLKKAAPVYRAVWWPRHRQADVARRDDVQALAMRYADGLVKRLTAVYGTSWPAEPRRIDLVAYANWAGAYSTDGGLIVFASTDPAIAGLLGLEILLHESSHQWDDQIHERLAAAAAKAGKPLPVDLSHTLIFYTTGDIVAQAFPDYVPYAVKFGLWNRGGFARLKPILDRYWQPYLRGKTGFDEAIGAVITAAALKQPAHPRVTRSASAKATAPATAAPSGPGR